MVTQAELDRLEADLTAVRAQMGVDREDALRRVGELQDHAAELRERAVTSGSPYEPAVACVHELLGSLRRGLEVTGELRRMAA
ncbi:MAG: hypothetical protein AAGA57_02290 [Planctomycetota bacterium]